MAGTRAFEVAPNIDLQVTYGPEPLTAGMTPELQDPSKPLTFTVKDSIGKDVDLTRGIKDGFGVDTVILKDMQMHLFADPHPDNSYYHGKGAKLPQYYWLRTDLQNYSIGLENNMYLYSVPNDPFTPIVFTKNEGNYIFKGFCANDQGEFDVYVYTPDRKHCGMVTVKVKQPHVEYEVKNVESGQIFNVRGNNSTSANAADPDFVMTALDNRLYNVTVTAWDAQGSLIKGIAQDVSVCSGSGQDTARFTTLKLVVGNTIKIFNGKLGTMLIVPPAVSTAGMPMIPVEEIQDIGFTFTPGNTMTFKVGSAEATCTIGSTVGTLNGNPFTLSEPPVLSSGKALVPASFFEKVLAMNTKAKVTLTYEPAGRVILIRILE